MNNITTRRKHQPTFATTPANILAQASLKVFPLAVATAFKASAVTSTPLVPTTMAESEATSSCFCASLSPSNDETGMISGDMFCGMMNFRRGLDISREKVDWSHYSVSFRRQLQGRNMMTPMVAAIAITRQQRQRCNDSKETFSKHFLARRMNFTRSCSRSVKNPWRLPWCPHSSPQLRDLRKMMTQAKAGTMDWGLWKRVFVNIPK